VASDGDNQRNRDPLRVDLQHMAMILQSSM
jgi:hypothetical protein